MPNVKDIAERGTEAPEALTPTEVRHLCFWITTHAEHVRAHQALELPTMLRASGRSLLDRIARERPQPSQAGVADEAAAELGPEDAEVHTGA